MALYDIRINGVALAPPNPSHWGVDKAKGLHMIPSGKDIENGNPWGPGVNVIPGPPASSTFSIEAWVEGDGSSAVLEARLADFLNRFRATRFAGNAIFEWQSTHGWLKCPMRIVTCDVDQEHAAHSARVKLVMENLWGVWRSSTSTLVSGSFPGSATLDTGHGAVYDAKIVVTGPVTNPRFVVGNRYMQWTGSVPAGSNLVLHASPIFAQMHNASVLFNLDWWGSFGRGLDIYPGEPLTVTGSGTTSQSSWRIEYQKVYY